ncbi:pentapeptide repeat-containing protein [Pseudanabaena sp. PCC 6802]|uniref:pentapeptide repeat-containing protein n=1 Tax=Pseudanabaena sp. PCC 6802 TaxID=118173 RepID=UPI00037E0F61|nr:pentapeptide repeat-containing protein [Pseudanabaena sp. PCC 6802]
MSQEQQDTIKVSLESGTSNSQAPDTAASYAASTEVKQLWEGLVKRYERLDLEHYKPDKQDLNSSPTDRTEIANYSKESSLMSLPPSKPQAPTPSSDNSLRRAGLREKKLWNSLKVLLVSAALVSGIVYLQEHSKQREIEGHQAVTQREQALVQDNARQESLNRYFDTMTALLFDRKLRTAKDNDEVRVIAHAKTITTLQSLDSKRKGLLLLFLQEAKLIERDNTVISLTNADLSYTNLSSMNFYRSNLSGTNLNGADLSNTNLSGANLSSVNLSEANLSGANLGNANLSNANLDSVNFSNANLNNVNLSNVNLEYAFLCKTILSDATISNRNCKKLGIAPGL